MKKTLAALAVLSAFAGSAMAADVTLYGVVDTGLNYKNVSTDREGVADTDTFSMRSGQSAGSRFGLKGTEDLGNGMKVGFVLENGFDSDTGKLGQGDRLFGREANLYLQTDYGTLSMGRVGALSSGLGSYNVVYGYTALGTGWGETVGDNKGQFGLGDRDRFDNTITYITPSFAGLNVYAQYSFEANGQEKAGNENQNKRYAAIGAKYEAGAFSTGLVVDAVFNPKVNTTKDSESFNDEDSLGVFYGASFDFGVAKVMGLVQYGKNENKLGGVNINDTKLFDAVSGAEGLTGYALSLGVSAPVMGGTVFAQANYVDGEVEAMTEDDGFDRWGVALAYNYPLSKRTSVYAFAGYNELSVDKNDFKDKTTEAGFGICHKF